MQWYKAIEIFTDALASSDPTPGGGAAAAQAGAMGCALAMMAIQTTLKKKNISQESKQQLEQSLRCLVGLKVQLSNFVKQDGDAYESYMTVQKLPKENANREQLLQDALVLAAKVPVDVASACVRALKEIEIVSPFVAKIILSDALCAKHLCRVAIKCSIENINANKVFIKNEDKLVELDKHLLNFSKFC